VPDTSVLPHDLAAERAVLGACLRNPGAYAQAAAVLGDGHGFYRDGHRIIFREVAAVAASGEPVDLVTVGTRLARKKLFDEIGGPAYLSSLTDGVPHAMNVTSYARIVIERARLRQAIAGASDVLRAAYTGDPIATTAALTRLQDFGSVTAHRGLEPAALADAVDVAREGQAIAETGVPYLVDGLIPAYGMAGFNVGFAKTGKTTFGTALGAAVAHGRTFIERATQQARVLVIAAEDPAEYTAYGARHLDVPAGMMTFYRGSLVLTPDGLNALVGTVVDGGYGFVQISSWQAVIRGLVADENDNAGAVLAVEALKAAARTTGVPWLVDAHSGKGEDQGDEADPSKALRGASAAAGAADFLLSLRYADGPFGTRRRLSGKGRFVSFAPMTIDFDPTSSTYAVVDAAKDIHRESTWRLIVETGAIDDTPRSLGEIASLAGLLPDGERLDGNRRRQIAGALKDRLEVGRVDGIRRGQKTTLYRRLGGTS
jgi:hypothetical protein